MDRGRFKIDERVAGTQGRLCAAMVRHHKQQAGNSKSKPTNIERASGHGNALFIPSLAPARNAAMPTPSGSRFLANNRRHGWASCSILVWRLGCHSRSSLVNNYYSNPDVRARMLEFLGGNSLEDATC